MTLKVYSIRDLKGEIFNSPFYARSFGEAERGFTTLVRDPKSTIFQYPSDYDLYYLGTFDDQSGLFSPEQTPKLIMNASSVTGQNDRVTGMQ